MSPTQQLEELKTGRTCDIDGYVDQRGVLYIGHAWELVDGTWRCLANVSGALRIVECTITPTES